MLALALQWTSGQTTFEYFSPWFCFKLRFCTISRAWPVGVIGVSRQGLSGFCKRLWAQSEHYNSSRLPAVLAVATLASLSYTPPEPSTPAGASAAQDLRSGPGPIGGEWPDPFQNDSDRASASDSRRLQQLSIMTRM